MHPSDEDRGPAVVFADGTERVQLADMSGDGLVDIVRIRNGEVCYWPNLGYGRFGAKITMDGAPRFTTLLRRSSTAWVARHGLKLEDLTPLTAALKAKGFRLARTVPYLDAGALRFASLYRPAGKHGWQAWVGDADPSVRDKEFRAQGFALLQAVSYDTSAGRRWSCVWQKAVGEAQDYFWGS